MKSIVGAGAAAGAGAALRAGAGRDRLAVTLVEFLSDRLLLAADCPPEALRREVPPDQDRRRDELDVSDELVLDDEAKERRRRC
ncbi:MAG TPA: hypothetical protein DD990_33030, partial [Cyanobacteria bacterium UBA11368]|nr:hypothetical protein [Cyanobacteria bacterium UBA11368]